jgi:hypothetical protein
VPYNHPKPQPQQLPPTNTTTVKTTTAVSSEVEDFDGINNDNEIVESKNNNKNKPFLPKENVVIQMIQPMLLPMDSNF